ncbi:hypothetical protein KC340_g9720 [Hortaea werneckii]|nr:hypothetical protein KC342_g8964 [Hortaea werneckii]KAI7097952.1 hypothetical protein KC339_g9329 [Hortaea werneckii]KAI7216180.1 hypothetical protein KC365_g13348 [Hortaea werneckii]KAI7312864.1 hypothetical protein KC340_g9720 [Hortaea werneckii]KAI7380280.1 hypothetical protein KC328_g12877 [Hortaea werneckii]
MTTDHLLDLQWQASEIESETEGIIGWTGSEAPWPSGQNIFEVVASSPIPDEIPASSDAALTFSAHSYSQDVALKSAITFEIFQSPTPIIDSHHPLLDQTFNTYDMDTRQDEPIEQDLPPGAIDPTDDYIDERQIQKRKLRPQTSRAGFMSTWIDHDETGNYDPNEELRQRRARIWRRRPRTHTEDDENVSLGLKEDENKIKTALLSVAKILEVKLHFASDAGKSAFRDHVKRLSAAPRQDPQDFARGQRLRDCGRDRFTHQDADHSGPCEDCASEGCDCEAAPRKENIIQRIRTEGKACSLASGVAGKDCLERKKPGNTIKPHTAPAARKRKAGTKPAEDNSVVKQQKNSATADIRHKSRGATKKIVSRFSHPIHFNAEDASGSSSCSFCEHTSFQIIGLEAKEYDIIEWQDGRGYDEIGGGHREDGVEPTRVCTACTMRRLLIVMCEKHHMCLISGLSPETMDVEGAINSLFSGALRQQDRWCSVCPSLASYECKTASSVDLLGHECQGCGLSLCETCMLSLTDKHKGDLHQMLNVLKDEASDERPLGLRADWSLLKQDGLLMRYVLWANA